jgi:signal transduction histidine kinase
MRTTSHILLSPEELDEDIQPLVDFKTVSTVESRGAAESIAHDLNNVLSLIAMATELLGFRELGPEEQRFLGIIEDGITRGHGISRRLFDLVKGAGAQ